jgi:LDH2 family malate/lactate/ureidoglycolate dehydrogenase
MMWLAKQGLPMPIDYAITKDGENTTDPNAAMDGTLLPIGGPKGYGLSFMTDVMTGVMTGAAFGSALYKNPKSQDVGHLLMAIDVEWFMLREEYDARLQALVEEVQGSELRPGVEHIYLPGEIEHLREQKKRAEGVPLERSVYEDLKSLAGEIGVEFGLKDQAA